MTTIDDIIARARDVAVAAGKMTGEVFEISKGKFQALKISSNIQKSYEKLGSIVYDSIKYDTENSELVNVCVAEIDALIEELADVNSRISDLKSVVVCSSCGYSNPTTAYFCAKCGSSIMKNDAESYTNRVDIDEADESKS